MVVSDKYYVYSVTKEWTNYDGWGKMNPQIMGTFFSEENARQFIFKETGQQTALDYGHATVTRKSGDLDRWFIHKLEMSDKPIILHGHNDA